MKILVKSGIYMSMYICIYVYVYIYCIRVCVCIHTYICVYTHTHHGTISVFLKNPISVFLRVGCISELIYVQNIIIDFTI